MSTLDHLILRNGCGKPPATEVETPSCMAKAQQQLVASKCRWLQVGCNFMVQGFPTHNPLPRGGIDFRAISGE